jgi:hypothetical protein
VVLKYREEQVGWLISSANRIWLCSATFQGTFLGVLQFPTDNCLTVCGRQWPNSAVSFCRWQQWLLVVLKYRQDQGAGLVPGESGFRRVRPRFQVFGSFPLTTAWRCVAELGLSYYYSTKLN